MSSPDYGESFRDEAMRRMLDARLVEKLVVANPAAGSELSVTVPGGEVWEFLSLCVQLQTSGVVSARSITLVFDDGTDIVGQYGMQDVQNAGNLVRYTFAAEMGFSKTTYSLNSIYGVIPRQWLPGGWRARTLTANLDAGDDYTSPVIVVRRYSPGDLIAFAKDIAAEIESVY